MHGYGTETTSLLPKTQSSASRGEPMSEATAMMSMLLPTRRKHAGLAFGLLCLSAVCIVNTGLQLFHAVHPKLASSNGHEAGSVQDREYWDASIAKWEIALANTAVQQPRTRLSAPSAGASSNLLEQGQPAGVPPPLYFNNTQAFDLLAASNAGPFTLSTNSHFYHYQRGWEAQVTQAFCAVAASAAIMNSLEGHISLPVAPIYAPFHWATQFGLMLNPCAVSKLRYAWDDVEDPVHEHLPHLPFGLGLEMAETLLRCNLEPSGYTATAHHVDSTSSVAHIRQAFLDALHSPTKRVMVNFDHGPLQQIRPGGGHFSPIAAYNAERDAFLILDVAKYKYPPAWISTPQLVQALNTVDNCGRFTYPEFPVTWDYNQIEYLREVLGCEVKHRGYIIVQPKTPV